MKTLELVEVGLRDGLQNEKNILPADERVRFVGEFLGAGLRRIELGAYVHPVKVPQMAGSGDVIRRAVVAHGARAGFSALVPNERGYEDFLRQRVPEIAIFGSVTESFSRKNIDCSIDESFARFAVVAQRAKKDKVKLRGYLSMCFGCPYEGEVDPRKVVELTKRMLKLGCFEVSIGDTIGVASPADVSRLLKAMKKARVPLGKIAGHFHDTRGTALANILAAYQEGVRVFDTSLGGLGGCPYAPGAAGNVATEDVVYMFQRMGQLKKIDLEKLVAMSREMGKLLDKKLPGKLSQAGPWPKRSG